MISKRLSFLVLCLVLLVRSSSGQDIKELPSGYLMTVAAYLATGEGYAIRYTKQLVAQGYNADYGFTYSKNMYFVYIKHYTEFKTAISAINSTRKNTPFDDAWVYVYEAQNKPAVMAPVDEEPPNQVVVSADTLVTPEPVDTISSPIEKPQPPIEVKPDGSRIIQFDAYDSRTQEKIAMDVSLFDPFTDRVITTMKSGEAKRVRPPWNKDKVMMVKTTGFGWRTDAADFNFEKPVTDSTNYFLDIANDTLYLSFEMQRLRKGDTQTLYHVFFISDATIMKPTSKAELQDLLALLRENPDYRIRLHGHTNGTAPGSYTRLAEGDTVFFRMTKHHQRFSGSAKKLSYDRANTVKQYLIAHGITADRIEIKGWGGKKMLYDENSDAAQRNIRVEVEVLDQED